MIARAALHVHSDWSYDGKWTLDQIGVTFAERGYGVVLMTEHDLGFTEERRLAHRDACRRASTDRLLIIPGMEYSDPANTVHLLVWGDVPFLGAGRATREVLEQAAAKGGVCVLAHPSRRSAWKEFRNEWLMHLAGIELWNRKTDGWAPSREAQKLIVETGARPVAGLDFHSAKQLFPMTVLIDTQGKVREKPILDALRTGAYRCEAFGMNLETFTGGIPGRTARVLESSRRLAARVYRSLRARSSAVQGSVINRKNMDADATPVRAEANNQ